MTDRKLTATFVGSYSSLDKLPADSRPQIALAGRSNVGKSSLFNRLVGHRNLALVSATPGKTRLLNFFLVNERFYLVDLPGYGYAKVSRSQSKSWGKLIEQYLTKSPRLAGLLLLLDSRREPTPEDRQLLEWLAVRGVPVLAVITKSDKVNKDQLKRKVRQVETAWGIEAIAFSIISGLGKSELIASIRHLVANGVASKKESA